MNQGIFLFGIVNGEVSSEQLQESHPDVYVVPSMGYSVIVAQRAALCIGEFDRESLARLLLEHQTTLEALMQSGIQLLPVKLGTFVSSDADVESIIEQGYRVITDMFTETEGACEMEVVAKWRSFPDLLREIAADKEVQELRRVIESRTVLANSDTIEIGKLMKEKIEQKNAAVSERILKRFAARTIGVKQHEVMDDEMLFNAGFLIDNGNIEDFYASIEALDREMENSMNFRIVGPLPCYSFCTIEVREISMAAVDEAREILGVGVSASQEEIRKAFRAKAMFFHPDLARSAGKGNGQKFAVVRDAYVTLTWYGEVLDHALSSPVNGMPEKIFSVRRLN